MQPQDKLLSINGNAITAGEDSLEAAVGMIRTSGGAPLEVRHTHLHHSTKIVETALQLEAPWKCTFQLHVQALENSC